MAITKYSCRNDSLLDTKEEYLTHTSIMAGCEEDDILIVKSKITEEQALERVKEMIWDKSSALYYGVNHKLFEALRIAADPVIHKEYYSVIASEFHISDVEYEYTYYLNGTHYTVNPIKCGANMDFPVAVETLDGRYRKSGNDRIQFDTWDDVLIDECIDDFEEGFKAHKMFAEDEIRESKESMRILNAKLRKQTQELVQSDLGKSRTIDTFRLIDREYTYVTKVFAAPYYIFNYDLGNKIVTISVDAYSGTVGTPLVNNPLGYVLLAKTEEEPYFSVGLCVICGIVCIGLGAALYALYYLYKKAKFNKSKPKDAPKYTLDEMKKLI